MNKQDKAIGAPIVVFVILTLVIIMAVYNSSLRSVRMKSAISFIGDPQDAEIAGLSDGLEKERKRKLESRETVQSYKKHFSKDYSTLLAKDLAEFKKERGIEEFRKRFDYDLIEYEFYTKADAFVEDKYSIQQGINDDADMFEMDDKFGWGAE